MTITEGQRQHIRDVFAEWLMDDSGMPDYNEADALILLLYREGFEIVPRGLVVLE